MGLEKVIERIEEEGAEKITGILQDAERQAAEILRAAQKTLDALSLKRKQESEKQMETWRMQERSGMEIEAKKIRLNAEKDILNQTYQECLAALQSLPHEKMLSSLLKKVKEEMPEAAVIYSNKRDEGLVRSLSRLTHGGTMECLGGIVVENTDRTVKLDYQYETIAASVWDQYLKGIAEKALR